MKQYENVFRAKNTVYAREFDTETSISTITPINYVPKLWIPCKEETTWKSFYNGKNLKELSFNNKKEYRQSKELYSSSVECYGHANDELSWIRDNYPNPIESFHAFKTWYIDIEVTSTETQTSDSPTGWKPDEADLPITLIQIYDTFAKEFYVFGLKEWKLKDTFNSEFGKVNYWKFSSEENLLKAYIKLINKKMPTVQIGFNSKGYDYPYITNRIARVLDNVSLFNGEDYSDEIIKGSYTKQLSPVDCIEFDWVENEQKPSMSFMSYKWKGIFLEDFQELYKKYTFNNLPSYSLSSVAGFELGEDKISHDEFTSFSALYLGNNEQYVIDDEKNLEDYNELDKLKIKLDNGEDVLEEFKNEAYHLFVTYGIKDVELLIQLEKKLSLFPLAQFIAYTTGVTVDDVKGTLKQWHNFMFNHGYKQGKILPLSSPYSKETDVQFVGGWTFASRKINKWVSSLDYTSLYPSIAMWANLGTDTLVEYKDLPKEVMDIKKKYFIHYSKDIDKKEFPNIEAKFIEDVLRNPEVRDEIHNVLVKYNLSATPNGVFFRKDRRSVFSELIEQLMVDRKTAKKEMKRAEAEVEKIKKEIAELEALL